MRSDVRTIAAGALLLCASATGATDLVIRAGRAFDGRRLIEGPVTLVVRDGRLVEGPPAPGARVLDATHACVMPGLVDLRSGAGLGGASSNEESSEITPAWRVIDAVDGQSPGFERALEGGVTTVVLTPGARAIVGGVAAAVKTDDRPLSRRIVGDAVAVVAALGFEPGWGNRSARFQQPWGLHFRRPGNRMGAVAELRRAISAAQQGAAGADAAMLRRMIAGDIPAWFVARTANDARTVMSLGAELGIRPLLLEPIEGHRIADDIARGAAGAVVGPEYQLPRRLPEVIDGRDARAATASILHAAGVTVALVTGPLEDPAGLRDRASLACRHGLPPEAALAAVTSVPARLIGQEARLGTLGAGADADIVIIAGDPLSPASTIEAVFIEGRLVHGGARWREALEGPETPR